VKSRGQSACFRAGDHFFLEVSEIRRYNNLQMNRSFLKEEVRMTVEKPNKCPRIFL
jgi:hypothetical protein